MAESMGAPGSNDFRSRHDAKPANANTLRPEGARALGRACRRRPGQEDAWRRGRTVVRCGAGHRVGGAWARASGRGRCCRILRITPGSRITDTTRIIPPQGQLKGSTSNTFAIRRAHCRRRSRCEGVREARSEPCDSGGTSAAVGGLSVMVLQPPEGDGWMDQVAAQPLEAFSVPRLDPRLPMN